jgi:Tfp pilus assembly protein PilF
LGGALLKANKTADAEKVFREDLQQNPRNPRSLFGLCEALKLQGRDYDAQFVEKQYRGYWDGHGLELKVENLI